MNSLKNLAYKAKSRLMNKNLRDTYSSANASSIAVNNFNFYNNEEDNQSNFVSPFKYLLREDKLLAMSREERERYILKCIQNYQNDKYSRKNINY